MFKENKLGRFYVSNVENGLPISESISQSTTTNNVSPSIANKPHTSTTSYPPPPTTSNNVSPSIANEQQTSTTSDPPTTTITNNVPPSITNHQSPSEIEFEEKWSKIIFLYTVS
jgi:hypothetical protein